MKTFKSIVAAGLVCMAVASGVQAQESRIAFINSQRITSESGPAKAATAKLEFIDLLKRIQQCDSDVRTHVQPWMASVKTLLAGLQGSAKDK